MIRPRLLLREIRAVVAAGAILCLLFLVPIVAGLVHYYGVGPHQLVWLEDLALVLGCIALVLVLFDQKTGYSGLIVLAIALMLLSEIPGLIETHGSLRLALEATWQDSRWLGAMGWGLFLGRLLTARRALLWSYALLVAWCLGQLVTAVIQMGVDRTLGEVRFHLPVVGGMLGHPTLGAIAGMLLLILIVSDGLAQEKMLSVNSRWIGLWLSLATIITSTRLKPLPALIAAALLLASRRFSTRIWPAAAAGLCVPALVFIGFVAGPSLGAGNKSNGQSLTQNAISHAIPREKLTAGAERLARMSFPIGWGLGTYGAGIDQEVENKAFDAAGLENTWGLSADSPSFRSDSFVAHILAERGWLGLALWIGSLLPLLAVFMRRASFGLFPPAAAAAIVALAPISSSFHDGTVALVVLLPAALVLGARAADPRLATSPNGRRAAVRQPRLRRLRDRRHSGSFPRGCDPAHAQSVPGRIRRVVAPGMGLIARSGTDPGESAIGQMTRRLDIQGLRALAILAILAYHADLPLEGGFTGVDVFFVISGFVIAGSLLGERDRSGRISLGDFYARRVRRLLPAPAVMLVLVALAGVLANPVGAQHMAAMTGIFASFLGANGYLYHLGTGYFDVSTSLNPLLHTWMLAVIAQIYVVFPLLLIAGERIGRRRLGRGTMATWVIIGLASSASFSLSFALSSGFPMSSQTRDARLAFYASPTRAWEFGVGALLMLALPLLVRIPNWVRPLLAVAGAIVLGASVLAIHKVGYRESDALIPVAGTALLLAAGSGRELGLASRLLGSRPLARLGDISFSLYLWHWPLIVFAAALFPYHEKRAALIAALVSFLPAWLSYRFVENPARYGLRLGSFLATPRRNATALAGICVLLPIGANVGLLGTQSAINNVAKMKAWRNSFAYHADVTRGCDNSLPLNERKPGACTWRVRHSRGMVVLFGDSYAGQYTESVVRAGNRAHFDVTVVTHSGCPFYGLGLKLRGLEDKTCARFSGYTQYALTELRPSLVIVAASTVNYLTNPSISLAGTGTGFVTGKQGKARLVSAALTATLTRLGRAHIPVIIVHPIPRVPVDTAFCAVGRILFGRCTGSVSRAVADAQLKTARTIEDAATRASSNGTTLDFENEICGSSCSNMRGSTPLYRDPGHLSVTASLALTDDFYRAITAHAVVRSKAVRSQSRL